MAMWAHLAHWILDHRRSILVLVAVITAVLGYQAMQVKTDHTTGHFLSKESKTVQDFLRASEVFGQSQTILYLVFEGADPYDPAFLQTLDLLEQEISRYQGVEHVL